MSDTVIFDEPVKRGPGRPPKPIIVEPPEQKMLPVRLLKHYSPRGQYDVVEWAKPPAAGCPIKAEYYDKKGNVVRVKLWAGTMVRLPRDEVVALLENQTEHAEFNVDSDGKIIPGSKHKVRRKFPLAERADALPI